MFNIVLFQLNYFVKYLKKYVLTNPTINLIFHFNTNPMFYLRMNLIINLITNSLVNLTFHFNTNQMFYFMVNSIIHINLQRGEPFWKNNRILERDPLPKHLPPIQYDGVLDELKWHFS
jgi:hypothetical protein